MRCVRNISFLSIFVMFAAFGYPVADRMLITLENQLRSPEFAKEVLPKDFSSLIFLIQYGKKTCRPLQYTHALFRAYTTLLKGSEYVDVHTLISFLTEVTPLMEEFFVPQHAMRHLLKKSGNTRENNVFARLQKSFALLLQDSFIENYNDFKEDPDVFLQDLALQSFSLAEEAIVIQALRESFLKFIDLSISKLLWLSLEPLRAWELTKILADKLANLTSVQAIVKSSEFNDLSWSLVHRFCYCIDIQSRNLPLIFYRSVLEEIENREILFLDIPEEASFLETKRSYLTRMLMTFEAKMRLDQWVEDSFKRG